MQIHCNATVPNSIWRGHPCLPSQACMHSLSLTSKAYQDCGDASSALHAMVLLQVPQVKALKDLHEGGHDPEVLQELCITQDLMLRAAKVAVQYLVIVMSTCGMWDASEIRSLNSVIWETGQFKNRPLQQCN